METADCVVIGAGVVGLATARALARKGREVLILESEDAFGTATSSRNSEVIHAGIFYTHGSLKEKLCIAGRDKLYAFCDVYGITYKRTTKLVYATDEAELPGLKKLQTHAARTVVNCAGLGAQGVSRAIKGVKPASVPPQHYAKGNYFYLSGKPPFTRLIYPLPGHASLGLHYTLDLADQGRFGPDLEWTDTIDYRVNESREASFYEAIRKYWPGLPDGALRPGYTGIRPKIQGPGESSKDFVIQTPDQTGVNGFVALYGIESPGLTSSLAIADYIADRIP